MAPTLAPYIRFGYDYRAKANSKEWVENRLNYAYWVNVYRSAEAGHRNKRTTNNEHRFGDSGAFT